MPDWRDGDAYQPLLRAERSAFAWEWLRRRPDYRAAALAQIGTRAKRPGRVGAEERGARHWGLHRFEDPRLTVPVARPMWSSDATALVLDAAAAPPGDSADNLHLHRLDGLWCIVPSSAREHLLLSDGFHFIRLDIEGTVRDGPVRLHYRLAGFASLEGPLLVLRRLNALASTGRFSAALHRADRRGRRHILLLRAFDAFEMGASQREIASELLSPTAGQTSWRAEVPSLRSQVQRLVRSARATAMGGYFQLLR